MQDSASNCIRYMIFTLNYVLLGWWVVWEILRNSFQVYHVPPWKYQNPRCLSTIPNNCSNKNCLCYIIKYFKTTSIVPKCRNKLFYFLCGAYLSNSGDCGVDMEIYGLAAPCKIGNISAASFRILVISISRYTFLKLVNTTNYGWIALQQSTHNARW